MEDEPHSGRGEDKGEGGDVHLDYHLGPLQ